MSKVFFFYNQVKVNAPTAELNGAQIKHEIQKVDNSVDLTHDLVLEGHGDDPDRKIADDENVDLTIGHGSGPKKFFLRPPTSFGYVN